MENRGDKDQPHSVSTRPDRQRLEWIDVARGIGIIAVVVGHVWTGGAMRDAVYSFHMPFFFLLSGMLSRPQPVARFTWRQVGSQMRPYAAFLLLLIVADQIIETLNGNRPIFHQWPQDIWPVILGGTWLRGPYTIFWFVPCLMIARILFNMILWRWTYPLARRWGLLIAFITLLAYGAGHITHKSVLGTLTVPMAFVLLWVGAAWGRVGWRSWMWLPLTALAASGLSGLFPTLNMKVADYGWPVLSIASAIATSLLLFRVSAHIAPWAGWLATLGRGSLVIMYLHVAVIHYLSPHMGKLSLLAVALLLPFIMYEALRRSHIGRRVFL